MSESSTPTPIPSIKRVDSDISELRHEIAQVREVLEQVSEIQLRSAEMNNRLLDALDRTTLERNEQADQFVERDQFMELVRKTAREEIAQAGKATPPAAPTPKQEGFFGSLQERRTLWLAIPLVLALFASAAAGYRLFNKPSDSANEASDRVSQNQAPAPATTAPAAAVPSSEPAQAVAEAPAAAMPQQSAPAQVAQSDPMLSQDEPLPPQDDSLRVQELNPNPPSALASTAQATDTNAESPSARATTQAASETMTTSNAAVEQPSVSVTTKSEPSVVVERSVAPTSATNKLFIPTEKKTADAPSGLESKPGPDLSALWQQDQPMTLGTVAASAAASNALEPTTGVVQATPETMTVTPSLGASGPAAAPVATPVPKPSGVEAASEPAAGVAAPAPSETTQIASTTTTEQSEPALPPIRPEVAMVLQRNLKRLGLYTGEVDGSVGPMTRRAIESFQSSIGNEPTGVFTPDEMFRLAQDAERANSQ